MLKAAMTKEANAETMIKNPNPLTSNPEFIQYLSRVSLSEKYPTAPLETAYTIMRKMLIEIDLGMVTDPFLRVLLLLLLRVCKSERDQFYKLVNA